MGRAQRVRHRDRAAPARADGDAALAPAGPEAGARDGDPGPAQPRPARPRRRAGQRPERRAWSRSARSSIRAQRAELLDRGLERLANFWAGEFEPASGAATADSRLGGRPVAEPAPVRRAARWDGFFPIDLRRARDTGRAGGRGGPSARGRRGAVRPRGRRTRRARIREPWADAGATWCLVGLRTAAPGGRGPGRDRLGARARPRRSVTSRPAARATAPTPSGSRCRPPDAPWRDPSPAGPRASPPAAARTRACHRARSRRARADR